MRGSLPRSCARQIRAVSITGVEVWRVEADELIDAVFLLEEQFGLDSTD
jgi:hypothetical protein